MENTSFPKEENPQESNENYEISELPLIQAAIPEGEPSQTSSSEESVVEGEIIPSQAGNVIRSINALLIALVVVIGAIAVWRASVAADAAGDADYYGLRALVNTEETRALNSLTAYRSYSDYIDYWVNKRQGELLAEEVQQKPHLAEDEQFVALIKSSFDLAEASQATLEQRYLNRDGTYNLQRQLGQLWADALKEKDLDFESQFSMAERMRNKTIYLLFCVMILSLAPVFYSLVESVEGRTQIMMILIGSAFAAAGTIFLLLVEFEKVPL